MNKLIASVLLTTALPVALSAAIPQHWTVETSRVQPAQFEAYHGETIEFAATMQTYGKPLAITTDLFGLYWQTNGMGSVYWPPAPVVLSNNVMIARWTPQMDVGADVYNCFIGAPGENYRAAFQLRLRPSPGAIPSELPLPVKTLDFAQVQVLNAPYYTQEEVESRITEATNALRRVDGAARPLPPYLHALDFVDTYPEDAAWYYAQPQDYGHCSSVRDGNSFARNYDWKFDRSSEFVVRMSAGPGRFASVGVANCGTNLTEEISTSGKWSRYYKCLPGRTVDGINENGVAVNVNVVSGDPAWQTGEGLHPLAAVRWVLDNAVSAASAAQHLAEHIRFPAGWTQNFHWMVADADETWIVENGAAHKVTGRAAMTNFPLYPSRGSGEGQERYDALMGGSNITSQWWTLTYTADGYRASDLPGIDSNLVFAAWASKPRESHRGETFGDVAWWQTVHTSVYDITNRTLRIAVQERDDWYVFSVPQGGKVKSVNGQTGDVVLAGEDVISDLATIRSGAALGATALQSYTETDPTVADWAKKPNPAPVTDLSPAFAYTTAVSNKLESGKQDVIDDLDDIRTGAVLGATALRAAHNTSTNAHEDIRETVGNKVDAYTINCDYYTLDSEHDYPLWKQYPGIYISDPIYRPGVDTIRYKLTINGYEATFTFEIFEGGTWVERMSLPGTVDRDTLDVIVSGMKITKHNLEVYNDTAPKAKALADYDIESDLSSSPTNIPTSSAVSAAVSAKYSKPSSGIPKTDLASAVQTSLGKADSALQAAHNTSTTAHADIRTAAANAQAHSEATRQIVYTWEDFLDGSNVVISITNYISGAYSLDHAKLQIKELLPDSNEYRIVYDSRTEITNHTAAAKREIVGYVDGVATVLRGEIADKGDKAWGRRSSTGQDVPISNTVWVTEQNLRIAGGMEYERVAVGEGAIYVLTSKGQAPYMTGDEGALMLKDDGGTNYFGMVRSDSYTIGCNTDGIRTQNNLVYLDYAVTMSDHPCIWYTESLEGDVEWEQLNLPDGSAVPGASHQVVWDESPRLGAQECYINCPEGSGFFRATIEVAGDARFRTNMPAEIPSFYCADNPDKKVKIIWNNGNPKFVEAN